MENRHTMTAIFIVAILLQSSQALTEATTTTTTSAPTTTTTTEPEVIIMDIQSNITITEHEEFEFKLRLREQRGLWTCCSEEEICTERTCVKEANDTCRYAVKMEPKRSFCGKKFSFKLENPAEHYDTQVFVNFKPNAPSIKNVTYHNRTNCLVVELEPEDTGECPLRYYVEYNWNIDKKLKGEVVGTKAELEGAHIESCLTKQKYNSAASPTVTVVAMNTVGEKTFGDQTTSPVTSFVSEDPTECSHQ